MNTPGFARLHLEVDLEIDDPGALQAHARTWAKQNCGGDPQALSEMLAQAGEGPESALMLMVEPDDVVGGIPGLTALGASMWVDDPASDTEATLDSMAPEQEGWAEQDGAEEDVDGESETEWLQKIFNDAAKLPGLNLGALGHDPSEPHAEQLKRSLHESTMLRGALHWAYETFIDELLEDVSMLRENPDELAETTQISQLPPLYAGHYGALFAQRLLAVAFDLGTAFATSFHGPSCVAQEMSLKLILDRVEILADMLPNLALPQDWRGGVEAALFADLDRELPHEPETEGTGADPGVSGINTASLDVSAWFTPFAGQSVNPYAANEE